ncbi:4-hydroxy-3-methylbut-2-enyl diphosphate reductase [Crocinitomicaceae bacterium]|nr:4-hydroxy-3-methylbut-2-enyl diphosphate reductase [Crocinitomicaceae bacterium]MDC0099703.1 4-hydroxy-3-methylbut-2-enyl diphosphate reductase [Crocinitomicaceae bacterium]MDC1282925.1 4-hydroxy-3-methylbut-2-enyl diphosphate reductase [Crocinitomicaceae bacterium]|tara:strand:+ start:7308 stop:8519 length:1212 start_codon:yes stop_codon:yes gene_type:complete
MKKFKIPEFYNSPIISKVKAKRKLDDPRKKDFTPSILDFGNIEFIISRHFGFCYGVENAIEKSYKAITENPDKNIYLLSEMIHNPEVNQDLLDQGLKFIQDTHGNQLIDWDNIDSDDIVIIPAFGTTIETEKLLIDKDINIAKYNTTCPFVEKVWNRSASLGKSDHTIIIHGKNSHEETKATFSHSKENSPSIVIKDINEAGIIANYILGKISSDELLRRFIGKVSDEFNPEKDLNKIGVVNQTTMLATETQEIADFLKNTMIEKHSSKSLKEHFADNRDTLCYATNDNQSATIELLNIEADLAIVVGGYNSSNTTHLVELLEPNFKTFFIKTKGEIIDSDQIRSFNIHSKNIEEHSTFLPKKEKTRIIITSGASCPDAAVDAVIQRILDLSDSPISINDIQF